MKNNKHKQYQITLNRFDQWMLYGFLAIVIVLPLAMSRITFDQFDIAKILSLRILTFVTLSVWVAKMMVAKKRELRFSKLDLAVVGFLVLVLMSTINSIHIHTAIHGKFKRYEGLLTFINYGILYFLALQVFTGFEKLSKLSKAIAYSGGLVALYGVMQYMDMDLFHWATLPFEQRRSFSTFGNPDLLAGFLVILLPIAAAEFLKASGIKDNAKTGIILFVSLMCLLTAFTRGAWLASMVGAVVFLAIGFKAIMANPKKLLFIVAAFVGIFVVIAVYSASTGHSVLNLVERLKSVTQITEGSAGSRLEIWKAGVEMIKTSPYLGLGPDTFRLGSEKYETLKYVQMGGGQTVADNAHNYVIQLGAGLGIPATVLFLAFFIAVVVIAIKYSFKLQGNDKLTYAGFIAAVIGYFVHLLFGVSISGSTGVFWVLLGALVAVAPIVKMAEVEDKQAVVSTFKAVMAIAVVISLISTYYAISMYVGDHYYTKAIQLSNQGNVETAVTYYEKSIRLYQNGRYYDGYGMFIERIGEMQQSREMINKAVAIYLDAKNFEPLEADHYVFLASALAKLATSPDDAVLADAVRELEHAVKEVRPHSLQPRLLLGNILLYQGKYEEAIDVLLYVTKISPQEPSTLFMLADCYAKLGEKDKAIEYYEKILSIYPDDAKAKEAIASLSK